MLLRLRAVPGTAAMMGLLGRVYDWQLPLERDALATAAQLAGVEAGERVLDVATGTGGWLRELVVLGVRPAEAVGVDRSASMLAVAAARLPDRWSLIRADARHLPFPERSFDVVGACYLLHLLDTGGRLQMLGEMTRVVRPGGRVVVVTVECRRPLARSLLALLPRRSGLRPLDPSRELRVAGLNPLRARFVRGGWPSLCVLAERRSGA